MVLKLNFYIDDSGTRHPDRQLNKNRGRPDWFALGGLLVREEDEEGCREMHHTLCSKWGITSPLHSEEIRHRTKNFRWLNKPSIRDQFLPDLEEMLLKMPVLGLACAIDRPGYHTRYHDKYGPQKWSLCRSAFAIGVERASKFANADHRKLNVYVERSDKKTDRMIEVYFKDLKNHGHPFDSQRASKYVPMHRDELSSTLYDFKTKNKSSQLMQIADLYLYPICKGGYDANYYPYMKLRESSKLLDQHVDDVGMEGVKYYCFERVSP